MSDLQNLTPANTYKALLQLDAGYTNGISGSTGANALQVSDGAGNNTSLALSTDRVGIGTTSPSQELDVNGDIASTTLTASGAVTAGSVSTSGAVGAGSIDVSGNVVADEYALDQTGSSSSAVAIHAPATNELAIRTNTAERVRIDSSGSVGIGTTSPARTLSIVDTTNDGSGGLKIQNYKPVIELLDANVTGTATTLTQDETNFTIANDGVDSLTIDSGGNVGIGTTSPDDSKLKVVGDNDADFTALILANNYATDTAGDVVELMFQHLRSYTDPTILNDSAFIKAVKEVAWDQDVNRRSALTFGTRLGNTEPAERMRIDSSGNVLPGTDDAQDFGSSSKRWDDIYATNTTIQSSDRELKQDIEELSEAETRVAQACKGLFRKYRWKDAVAQKGDEARIHFGIIAQDLEDAFTAEGLDAGRYGMFVKNTWWTADRIIPAVEAVEAVEAVYDEEGNEVSPAVEAVEAQPEKTVTDIFENIEDAPEGATEVTQRGVRYSELLAFIISAI